MKATYIYPGRFSPPTKGHFELLKSAALSLPCVHVVCSTNPLKKDIFSVEESKELWRSYPLPKNVILTTFEEMVKQGVNRKKIVMVRGLRNYDDFLDEKVVMKINKEQYGIDKFIYFFSSCECENISASKARELMKNFELENFRKYVSPLVISKLLEKRLAAKNIFLVVGRPGSGKSTFLKMLKEGRGDIVYINTDDFNKQLKPLLKTHFNEQNLIKIAIEREDELKKVIAVPWVNLLKKALSETAPGSNIFVEVAYGLQEDKHLYDLVGGKVLYIGCDKIEKNIRRVNSRGTKYTLPFIKRIPGWQESKRIAKEKGLQIKKISTGGNLEETRKSAQKFSDELK